MTARDAATAYLAAINAADLDAVRELLADDATLFHQLGTFEGPEAVLGFYRDVVFPAGVVAEPEGWIVDEGACVVQLLAHSPLAPGQDLHYIDVFRVNERGEVTSLTIYSR